MQKQIDTWQLIHQNLIQNIAVMLLYVLESKGSSPGRQGFFMAVNAAGKMSGSLGGGIMEHKFVELAKSKLQQLAEQVSIHKQVHDKEAAKNQSGMICSGEQTIFLYTVKKEETAVIRDIIYSLQQNKNGTLHLSPQGIRFVNSIPLRNFDLQVKAADDFLFTEKTGYKNILHIIGGGHCALALSRLMSNMDFYIHLYDERDGLNTIGQNNFVHQKQIVDDYAFLSKLVEPGCNSFVVIMTFGYRTDAAACKALLGKQFKYIGLLGSRNKIKRMFEEFREQGMDAAWLNEIHAPVGLAIKSQTPEEIAVSIAAEMIKVKNENG